MIGNLGSDPEVRHFPSGGTTVSVNLATTDSWKNKETGESQEKTEWHRLVFFNRLAEIVGQYLRKGSKIYKEALERESMQIKMELNVMSLKLLSTN